MSLPENSPGTEISVQSSGQPASWLHKALWKLCLVALGSVLAFHVALAYSPDLARYIPDVLVDSPKSVPTSFLDGGHGCGARIIVPRDIAGRCRAAPVDEPCLTDSLYREETPDNFIDLPADAMECLDPDFVVPKSGVAERLDAQASAAEVPASAID